MHLPVQRDLITGERVTVGIRPEGFELVGDGESGALPVRVVRVERLGSELLVYADPVELSPAAAVHAAHMIIRVDKRYVVYEDDTVLVRPREAEVSVFNADGRALGRPDAPASMAEDLAELEAEDLPTIEV